MEIYYNNNNVFLGQYLSTELTNLQPFVSLKGLDTNKKYTLIMNDPNAVKGNRIHWLVTDIHGNYFNTGRTILSYKGPAPPQNSGIHNYIFSLYETNKDITFQFDDYDREIEMSTLLNKLSLSKTPIYTTSFVSQNIQEHSYLYQNQVSFLIMFIIVAFFIYSIRKYTLVFYMFILFLLVYRFIYFLKKSCYISLKNMEKILSS